MVFEYCPKCGKKLDKKEIGDEGLVPFCGSCDRVFFSFSYTCVLCLVIDENENVVLTKAKPDSPRYGCVAGYVKEGETVEDAAKREVEEEIGLVVSELTFVKSRLHNTDTLMINFICKAKNSELKISEKELYSAEWFTLQEAQEIPDSKIGSGTKSLLTDYAEENY